MISLSLAETASIVKAAPCKEKIVFTGCVIDSRIIQGGNLFVAIKGAQFDGHDFVAMAKEKGAVAAIVERRVPVDLPQLLVSSTISALGDLARHWRLQHAVTIIGVTGSNGKTTTKDLLAGILKAHTSDTKVLAPKRSFNNHIGVPLTLFELSDSHAFAVIEMGMNHFEEIAYLTQIAHPQVAIITNAAQSHLKGVGSVVGVAKAKGEIFQGLLPSGVAVLNRQDAYYDYWAGLLSEGQSILSFGWTQDAMVYPKCYNAEPFKGEIPAQQIDCVTPSGVCRIHLPLLGAHNALNAMAATAAAIAVGVPLDVIVAGLAAPVLSPGRLQIQRSKKGCLVLNDTYNANPFSLMAAIEVLKNFAGTGKKILVLGDMAELGDDSDAFHQAAGRQAKSSGLDALWCLGRSSALSANAFGEGGYHFSQLPDLLHALQPSLKSGDCILVKGSRSMKMEKVVDALLNVEE